MEVFIVAYGGGLLGAVLMDICESWMAGIGISSGVSVALVGRWVAGLWHGRLLHADIRDAAPHAHEIRIGWAFHLLVGGGGVALLYPLFFLIAGVSWTTNHLLGGALFGLATSLLPWFILLPSFGWGAFGRRGPTGANALLASPLAHIPYGIGIGIVLTMM
jgi:hypothetical protein